MTTIQTGLRDSIGSGRRLFSLDVLRGVAASLVLVRHIPSTETAGQTPVEPLFQWLGSVGWIGVDLFFVLSGLLISSLIYREYDRELGFRPGRFLIRRGFKIWPAYFLGYGSVMFLKWAVAASRGNVELAQDVRSNAIWNALFVQNYVPCERWPHSWSIAVEEHFYIGLALLLCGWIAWRGKSRPGESVFASLAGVWGVAAISVLALRVSVCYPTFDWREAYYPSHMRIDSLLFGVLCGYAVWYRPEAVRTLAHPAVAATAVALAFLWPTLWPVEESRWGSTIGFTLIYLSFGAVLIFASLRPEYGMRAAGPIRYLLKGLAQIGVYSYTIYIAHSVLYVIPGMAGARVRALEWATRQFGGECSLWLDRLGFVGGSIALGVVLSHVVERPFLKLRSRLYEKVPVSKVRRDAVAPDASSATVGAASLASTTE
jgi:peptidoglycan/LPS O-acetylase OafA/YrhL